MSFAGRSTNASRPLDQTAANNVRWSLDRHPGRGLDSRARGVCRVSLSSRHTQPVADETGNYRGIGNDGNDVSEFLDITRRYLLKELSQSLSRCGSWAALPPIESHPGKQ